MSNPTPEENEKLQKMAQGILENFDIIYEEFLEKHPEWKEALEKANEKKIDDQDE